MTSLWSFPLPNYAFNMYGGDFSDQHPLNSFSLHFNITCTLLTGRLYCDVHWGLTGRTIIQLSQKSILIFFYRLDVLCWYAWSTSKKLLICNTLSWMLAYFQSVTILHANFEANVLENRCISLAEMAWNLEGNSLGKICRHLLNDPSYIRHH